MRCQCVTECVCIFTCVCKCMLVCVVVCVLVCVHHTLIYIHVPGIQSYIDCSLKLMLHKRGGL